MWLDAWVGACLLPLAAWLLLSGLDDLVLLLGMLLGRREPAGRAPSTAELARAPRRRIAILLPLWREHAVVDRMLEYNLAAARYDAWDVFAGAYPNDPDTQAAVRRVALRFANVHLAVCPHPGPTSKADCLNCVFEAMRRYERLCGLRFEIVVVHDAEDLIHPRALELINYWIGPYDMVQLPVLPLPTPWWEPTHGLYCDEFAEFQSKDVPVRQRWGGFLPSNGVGTGYARAVLDALAPGPGAPLFDAACLTEDYDIGYRIHCRRCPQLFLPIRPDEEGEPIATREYFPRSFPAAMRQRTRWVTGIALQGWQRHGWGVSWREHYWFWRDRKGLVGSLVTPAANILFLYGAAGWTAAWHNGHAWSLGAAAPPVLWWLCALTLPLSLAHVAARGCCAARIYGWKFAAGVPLRAVYGNWLNAVATLAALGQYAVNRARGRAPRWMKTEHLFPAMPAPQSRDLGAADIRAASAGARVPAPLNGAAAPGARRSARAPAP